MTNRRMNTQALADLTKAIKDNNKIHGNKSLIETLLQNIGIESALNRSVSLLTASIGHFINPFNNAKEAFDQADKMQKKMLGSNANLTKFMANNTQALKKLKGGLLDNAEELFANFEAGLRFNSDSVNTLQNRMRLTGQSTDQLRKTNKLLMGVTNNDVEAVGRLSKANMDLGRTYMVTNDKLLQALDRNSEMLDFASLFDEGEETSKAIQELTARMTSKGIAVDKQQTIIKFLGEQSQDSFLLRAKMGISNNVLEDIYKGQTSEESVLQKVADFAKTNITNNASSDKRFTAMMSLQSWGEGMKDIVVASNQATAAFKRTENITEDNRSKEDKFYDTMETAAKESKNFYDESITKFYDVMKPTPGILRLIHQGMVGGMLLSTVGKIAQGIGSLLKAKEVASVATAATTPAAARAAAAAAATSPATSTVAAKVAAKAGGGLLRSAIGLIGGVSRWLGPIGFIAGTFGPMLFDYLTQEKTVSLGEATENLNKSIEETNKTTNELKNITSANTAVNAEREKLIKSQQGAVSEINRLTDLIKKDGDEKLTAEITQSASTHLKKLNDIVKQGKESNLDSEKLNQLNKMVSEESNKFHKALLESSKVSAEKLAIIAKDKEDKKDGGPKVPAKRETLEDILHSAVAQALKRTPSNLSTTPEQMLKFAELNYKAQLSTLNEARNNRQYAAAQGGI